MAVGNINNYNIILFVHRSRKRSKHHMLFYSALAAANERDDGR